jgi:hypothetical protein
VLRGEKLLTAKIAKIAKHGLRLQKRDFVKGDGMDYFLVFKVKE